MLRTIKLNNEFCRRTIEINNVIANYLLPAKTELTITQEFIP